MSNHSTDDWQVIDHTNNRIVPADNRDDAESKINDFDGMDLTLEVCRPGEDPDVMLSQGPTEETEEPDVEVVQHGENSESDEADTPKQDAEDADVLDTQPVEQDPDASEDAEMPEFAEYGTLDDPLDNLPGWMKTDVSYNDRGDSSTTVNKRGCQVIANYLGLEYETTAITRASETGFEYAEFECSVTRPDGREYTGHGTARADGEDQSEDAGWKLDMQSETRAFKRAVKGATGGGIEAFAKEQEDHHA